MRLAAPLVPAAFFGIVLGLCGLGNTWRAAHDVWQAPAAIGEALQCAGIVVWAMLVVLFALKWLVGRDEALAEAAHPVQCCFIGLAGVATMLVAGGLLPYARGAALALFAVGAVFTVAFAAWRTGGLWRGERDEAATTPVLYLPSVAGCFVTATIAAALGYADWGQLAFGAGLFSWLAIESVLVRRLYNATSLAGALRPTMGVQLAPPAVGAVAYISVMPGPPDLMAHALIGYGLLQALILLRMVAWIRVDGFSPAYWAFTFGGTALATAPLRLMQKGDGGAVATLAPYLFGAANLLVGVVAVGTLWLAVRGRLAIRMVPLLPVAR